MPMTFTPHEWQTRCCAKALAYFQAGADKHFVINAAPGAGKTIGAMMIAKELVDLGLVDHVVIIAPRTKIVQQWKDEHVAMFGRGRPIHTMTSAPEPENFHPEMIQHDIAATWSAVQGLATLLQPLCENRRVLVIADEVHHAALKQVWGAGTSNAFSSAAYILALTGTPIRSDGEDAIWISEDLTHTAAGCYVVTYTEAIYHGWCQAASFHRHKGTFRVNVAGNMIKCTPTITKPEEIGVRLDRDVAKAVKYEKLVKQPITHDGEPMVPSYHSSMVEWASQKMDELRNSAVAETRVPNAGCLVIAQDIETAEYFQKLIKKMYPDEVVMLVHSQLKNPNQVTETFDSNTARWLVSVSMISEGVDIPRLRVMIYLPNAGTELYFRQAVGRVIRRSRGRNDDMSRAYVILPEVRKFNEYAIAIEEEMAAVKPKEKPPEGPEGVTPPVPKGWVCDHCQAENKAKAKECHACGEPRYPVYEVDYEETLGVREGAISRGWSVDEDEAQLGEGASGDFYTRLLSDPQTRALVRQFTPEMIARLLNVSMETLKAVGLGDFTNGTADVITDTIEEEV